jgi:phospholipase C
MGQSSGDGAAGPPAGALDRRHFLAGMGAATGALAMGGESRPAKAARRTIEAATAVKPAGSDIGAIEHVVLLMQENRSFDHYFGTYPGVRGFDDHPKHSLAAFSQAWPANTDVAPVGRLLPFHLDTANSNAECTFDLSHAWPAQHACWNNGAMDAWVTTHTSTEYEGPVNGVLTMGYYTRADLPFYYALADAFTINDAYHCSVFGPTDPNRVFWHSGTNDPDGRAGGPILVTSADQSLVGSCTWRTMADELEDHGVSWKVYNPPGSQYLPSSSIGMLLNNNCLMYFKNFVDEGSVLYQKAFLSSFPADFARDVARDELPAVSWMVAPTFPQDMSEHPPSPPDAGMYYVHQVLKTLAANPKVWAKTALFISYDENDGFFDHVVPPTPPPGTPGEYVTVDPLPADASGIAGPIGLGFRVPLLVLSPFSRGGHVVSEVSDHTSQLRFIETRFGVPVPNLSAWRRKTTGDLTATLHMGSSTPGLPALPPTAQHSSTVVSECVASQMFEINGGPPYPVPTTQAMPSQERPV